MIQSKANNIQKLGLSLLLSFITFYIYAQKNNATLQLVSLQTKPIIKKGDKGTEDNQFGFEGGTCRKVNGVYYLFVTEVFNLPKTAAVRLAIWKSNNGLKFRKIRVIAETNRNWEDTTNHMSPWAPNAVYDDDRKVWSVFNVGYRRKANSTSVYNMSGRILRHDSKVKGINGIAGPYKEAAWLDIDKTPEWFEGPGEMLSFYPYKVGKEWWAFYGANSVPEAVDATGATDPNAKNIFYAGLLKATRGLTSKWARQTALNPVQMDSSFVENSIVTKVSPNLYINLYDGANKQELSYACSKDGIHWEKEQLLQIPNAPAWIKNTRTPLCLINEGKGIYTIFFTAFDGKNPDNIEPTWHDGFGNVGKLQVKIITNKK